MPDHTNLHLKKFLNKMQLSITYKSVLGQIRVHMKKLELKWIQKTITEVLA